MLTCTAPAPTNVPALPVQQAHGEPLFYPGEMVATPNALAAIVTAGATPDVFLMRHLRGDWSEMAEEDRATNRDAVTRGGRIFSSYGVTTATRVWVITEADRSVTTILLPSEY